MKIKSPKEKYIFIELNKSDMEKLHLNYADMDYSNEETRRAIYSVLREAKMSLGQNFELSDTLRVEALPRDDGGCFLFFTISAKPKKYRYSGKDCKAVFLFENADNLIDASRALKRYTASCIESSLYVDNRKYYLVLSGHLCHSLIMLMNEYAVYIRNDEVPPFSFKSRIAEKNALEILCGGGSEG